jgi:uncharacterized membrane protein
MNVLRILVDALIPVIENIPWMSWNLILAVIPLILAARLFRHPLPEQVGRMWWWIGVGAFVAFLPNAPYVLTDLIHLSDDVPAATTPWRMAFAVVPQYVLFCAIGFGSYVVSLVWLVRFVRMRGWTVAQARTLEFTLHLLSATGVYLGRFVRFNTWDVLARPTDVGATLADLSQRITPIGFTMVFFIATCVLYWPSKHALIAVVSYVRSGGVSRADALAERYL